MKTDDDLMFAKYEPPPVVHGPWPADGHPFWKTTEKEHGKLILRLRALAAEYFKLCTPRTWPDDYYRNAVPRPTVQERK